jgi:hypothetical protein
MFQSKAFKDGKKKKESGSSPAKNNYYGMIKGREGAKKKAPSYHKFHICKTAAMVLASVMALIGIIMGITMLIDNWSRIQET